MRRDVWLEGTIFHKLHLFLLLDHAFKHLKFIICAISLVIEMLKHVTLSIR